jgi:hypothetical protein
MKPWKGEKTPISSPRSYREHNVFGELEFKGVLMEGLLAHELEKRLRHAEAILERLVEGKQKSDNLIADAIVHLTAAKEFDNEIQRHPE